MSTPAGTQWNFDFRRSGIRFQYRLIRRPGQALVVFLSSMRPSDNQTLEYYDRINYSKDITVSALYVCDPGLQLRLTLRSSWYQGIPEFFAAERIAHDLRQIAAEFRFDEAKTVLTGWSEGGFGALAVASYLPKARVLVEAPQANLLSHEAKAEVVNMARVCYAADTAEAIPAKFRERLDLATLFKARKHVPPGRILVRDTDKHHLDVHAKPLIAAFPSSSLKLETLKIAAGTPGHVPMPPEAVVQRLHEMVR
jgi:hypothetical protein